MEQDAGGKEPRRVLGGANQLFPSKILTLKLSFCRMGGDYRNIHPFYLIGKTSSLCAVFDGSASCVSQSPGNTNSTSPEHPATLSERADVLCSSSPSHTPSPTLSA